MSAQHYLFAHRVLPELLWNGDSLLGILANPENQDYLHGVWNTIPHSEGFGAFCESLARRSGFMEDMGVPQEDANILSRVVPPDGLSYASYWLGGEHLVVLVTMPPPERGTDAHFIAITHSPDIEYLTLERAEAGGTMFCKWTPGTHSNFGEGCEPFADSFLRSVCGHLGVSETIEAPTWAQCQGKSKTLAIFGNLREPLPAADEAKVAQWEAAAKEAMCAGAERPSWWSRLRKRPENGGSGLTGLAEAETHYRKIRDLRMNLQGVENTTATLTACPLVQVLSLQGKHAEALNLCREWWHQCRRYRAPGHQETHLATRLLGESLQAVGDLGSAGEMWMYRMRYFGLTRGQDSHQAQLALRDLNHFKASIHASDSTNTEGGGLYDY